MITYGNQNQLQSSLASLGDLLKALMFLSNLNEFISSPSPLIQGFNKGKVLPRCGRKRTPSDSITFFSLLEFLFLHNLCVLLLFWVNLVFMLCFLLHVFICLFFSFALFCFSYKNLKKIEKSEKYKNSVCYVYIGTCVPWMAIETNF